jgi:dihydrofolate synthase/folylpolyglutamate synthase
LEKALAACGYRMGLYTSPYIEKFNERISVCGEMISDEDLEVYTDRVVAAANEMVSEGHDSPTEFEVVTAIAFLCFKDKQVDIVVLEVGLGGSGDSTNVIDEPLASVICSISYDHMDRLGNTIEEIAADKAGIIKRGCPVISNVENREAAKVIAKKAYEMDSRLYDVSGISCHISSETPWSQTVSMEIYEKDYSEFQTAMVGPHQGENLKTALATIEVLRRGGKIRVSKEKLQEGIELAVQPGRFETVSREPLVILDGAHNEAGARALAATMNKYFKGKKALVCLAILADKQVDDILNHLTGIEGDFIASEADNPRKLDADKLADKIRALGRDVKIESDADSSVRQALSRQEDYDVILFAGSLYYIGQVRRTFKKEI